MVVACHDLRLAMGYLLPRTILVVMGWGVTCALIRRVWPSADMAVFALAGASWLTASVAYFGYLHKLRRDIVQLERALGYSSSRHSSFN
jgi:Flp pilus assembly protein TadB